MKKLNIGIIAHVDAGKTTLTENILFLGGVVAKAGRVDKGDTQTDAMAVERRRGISVRAAATSFCRDGIKFNLIDTPGHVDFVAEVERNLAVLDGVVLVISAKEGLQSQTRILMDTMKARKIPGVIFINKIDRMGANVEAVMQDTKDYMDGRLIVTQRITADGKICDLADNEFMEAAADTLYSHDDDLMTQFVNGEAITPSDFYNRLMFHTQSGGLYPVFFGSALYGIGVENLLDNLPNYLPVRDGDNALPLSAVVFKVDNSGKERLVYLRLFSGSICVREIVTYRGKTEKITRLAGLVSGKLTRANTIEAGDIAVLYSKDLMVGDILGDPSSNARVQGYHLGRPTLNVEIVPTNAEQRRALYEALALLADEDPMLGLSTENALTVQLFGEIQMEILREILMERYAIAAEFTSARTIYMEAPTQAAIAKITIGETFFRAGVGLSITPLPRGSGLEYIPAVPLGALTQSFQAAVEEAVFTTCKQGLFGWEMTDMRIVFDHSDYDSVTSTPAAFRDLVPLVLMQAIANAEMALLEPILDYELQIPREAASKAMYDLRMMNATIDSTNTVIGDAFTMIGQIPADVCRGYGAKIGSYTEGRGVFLTKFSGYRTTPFAAEKVNDRRINPASNPALYVMQKLGAR